MTKRQLRKAFGGEPTNPVLRRMFQDSETFLDLSWTIHKKFLPKMRTKKGYKVVRKISMAVSSYRGRLLDVMYSHFTSAEIQNAESWFVQQKGEK